MFPRYFAFTLLLTTAAPAVPIPEGGVNVLPTDWHAQAKFQGRKELATAERTTFPEHGAGWRIAVADDTASPSQLQLTTVLSGEVKAGDKVLLVFAARTVPGSTKDGRGHAQAVVEIKEAPHYLKLAQDGFDVSNEWQTITLPFPSQADSKAGLTGVSFMLGGKTQTLEITQLQLLNYGPAFDLAKLPHPTVNYPGREPDAPWRKAALERIEKIRTTDIQVEVVDSSGQPIPDAKVTIALQRHSFAFGTAIKAKYLMGTDDVSAQYRKIVDENFSAIVLENDLKPFAWDDATKQDGPDYRRDWTLGALAWAKQRGMRTRGHYLCWGPWEPWSEKLKDQPQAIHDRVLAHLDSVLKGTGGLVDEWDAVNHPVGWSSPRATVDQVINPDFYAEVFRAARARTGLPLYINEDQVFRPGRQQEEFYACIKDLIARGVRPDGLGNQAHFQRSFLPAPEDMLRVSDRFAALVPQLELTEFDIETNGDETLQADWLRDILIMAYSHPAYTGVMLWVFWEGAGWKPDTALWRKDWTPKANALAWQALVGKRWRTQATGKTDAVGHYSIRGHRGRYEITVTTNGQASVIPFNTENGTTMLRVVR